MTRKAGAVWWLFLGALALWAIAQGTAGEVAPIWILAGLAIPTIWATRKLALRWRLVLSAMLALFLLLFGIPAGPLHRSEPPPARPIAR